MARGEHELGTTRGAGPDRPDAHRGGVATPLPGRPAYPTPPPAPPQRAGLVGVPARAGSDGAPVAPLPVPRDATGPRHRRQGPDNGARRLISLSTTDRSEAVRPVPRPRTPELPVPPVRPGRVTDPTPDDAVTATIRVERHCPPRPPITVGEHPFVAVEPDPEAQRRRRRMVVLGGSAAAVVAGVVVAVTVPFMPASSAASAPAAATPTSSVTSAPAPAHVTSVAHPAPAAPK